MPADVARRVDQLTRSNLYYGVVPADRGPRRAPPAAALPEGVVPGDPRLVRAKARLDRLDWWPRPVRLGGVRIVVTPWLFRLRPWRRYDGFATHFVIFLRRADVGGRPDHARALSRLADAAPAARDAAQLPPHGL